MPQRRQDIEILLVEDNELTAIEIEQILHAAHFSTIKRAGNGREALDMLRQSSPDLIVSDLRMPVMGGYEFLQRLAEQEYRGGIIIVSGVDEEIMQSVESSLSASKLNILGIFSKPLDVEDIESAVKWVWPDA
ncbi:MAG: response regulator [Gammaproteobacteria bacterium]|nr:response regulator [Gammaproteobacteria bacterium]